MKETIVITKALADPNRVRTLMFLRRGELCVCQIIEMLGLAPSTVSKHMSILYQAGLVEARKQGRWMYYRLPKKPSPCLRKALQWMRETLTNDEQVLDDAKKLKVVLGMPKEKLCAYNKFNPAGKKTY